MRSRILLEKQSARSSRELGLGWGMLSPPAQGHADARPSMSIIVGRRCGMLFVLLKCCILYKA